MTTLVTCKRMDFRRCQSVEIGKWQLDAGSSGKSAGRSVRAHPYYAAFRVDSPTTRPHSPTSASRSLATYLRLVERTFTTQSWIEPVRVWSRCQRLVLLSPRQELRN